MATSKVILLVNYIVGAALTALTVIGVIKGYDVTALGIITGAVFAEISVSNAFYYWKAKKENVLKISVSAAEKANKDKVDDITKIITALGGIV